MLATYAFLAFWIVLGLGLFLLAMRGGRRRAPATPGRSRGRGAWRAGLVAFTIFFIALGVAVPLAFIDGNEERAAANLGGTRIVLTAEEEHGRELFGERCSVCHRLAAARASGTVGPSLDQLKPPKELVEDAIIRGRQRGSGTMPPDLYQGDDAAAVAAFVAATAGR